LLCSIPVDLATIGWRRHHMASSASSSSPRPVHQINVACLYYQIHVRRPLQHVQEHDPDKTIAARVSEIPKANTHHMYSTPYFVWFEVYYSSRLVHPALKLLPTNPRDAHNKNPSVISGPNQSLLQTTKRSTRHYYHGPVESDPPLG
jgi:hypothetical protein